MKTRILTFTLAAAALASCGKNDIPATDGTRTPLRVTASVEGATRAYDTHWERNDQIGISGQSGNLNYTNVSYKCSNEVTGIFEPTGSAVYFGDETGTFTAYYPYAKESGMTGGKIAASVVNQYQSRTFDFLYAPQTQARKDAPDVAFVFAHRMSKLVLHMYPGTGMPYGQISERYRLGLSQLHAEGTFDPADGSTAVTGNPQTLTFRHQDNIAAVVDRERPDVGVYYSIILFPETVAGGLELTVTELERITDNPLVTYSADLTNGTDGNLTLEPGKVYDYKVTVNRTGIVVSGATISDWTPGDVPNGGEVDATV